jgi:ribosome modulation factor
MKPYLIITAEALLVAAIASLMPLALYAGGLNELAFYSAHVFGAIVAWFFIAMIRIEYKFQHQQREDKFQRAHHLGFTHGLKEGVENNPFEDDMERHMYRIGYDAGVSEYCRVAHPEN